MEIKHELKSSCLARGLTKGIKMNRQLLDELFRIHDLHTEYYHQMNAIDDDLIDYYPMSRFDHNTDLVMDSDHDLDCYE